MLSKGTQADILIGGMTLPARDKIIDNFRRCIISTLICTNVLARGIDVPEVDLVINYEVPFLSNCGFKNPDYANYMHRVGRTGRFGTDGVAVPMVKTNDMLDQMEEF